MSKANYQPSLAFVWQTGYDTPDDGYHVTPGDAGGGTFGGVIEATWADAVTAGIVTGLLRNATRDQLSAVLQQKFWGAACDALPSGLDFMLFNGRMMSGGFPAIFQTCLGLVGTDVDGDFGAQSLKAAESKDTATLIYALYGSHYAYLKRLPSWSEFEGGWTKRLNAALPVAIAMASAQ